MATITERLVEIISELEQQRLSAQQSEAGSKLPSAAARHFSLAITKLEEGIMHKNRAEAMLMNQANWWDPEKGDTPRY